MNSSSDLVVDYLNNELVQEYLTRLASRWATLVPRLAKRTQALQAALLPTDATLTILLNDDFDLCDVLLRDEHALYRRGVQCWHVYKQQHLEHNNGVVAQFDLLLRSLLLEVTLKETIVAHWRATTENIAPDTLRVYSHAILVHRELAGDDVERVARSLRAA